MPNYKVLLDTNTIEDNTGDSVQVQVVQPDQTVSNQTMPDGSIFTGTITPPPSYVNLGNLKQDITNQQAIINAAQAQIDSDQATIDAVQPVVDDAITAKIASGAQDMRSDQVQVATPPLSEKQ